MKRAAIITAVILALSIPVVVVTLVGRGSPGRAPEDCTKDAIFCVQRVTRRALEADGFEEFTQVEESLRTETRRLNELCDEFATMPPPSRWERSRMRKHRALAESALDAWQAACDDLRTRTEGGAVPPHVRLSMIEALDEFNAARTNAWNTLILRPD